MQCLDLAHQLDARSEAVNLSVEAQVVLSLVLLVARYFFLAVHQVVLLIGKCLSWRLLVELGHGLPLALRLSLKSFPYDLQGQSVIGMLLKSFK